jgi:hypothetical protein
MNEKTVGDWLLSLPSGYRERAIRNTRPHNSTWKCDSICEALNLAFIWESSPEGNDFWDAVYEHYNPTRPSLPPLNGLPE